MRKRIPFLLVVSIIVAHPLWSQLNKPPVKPAADAAPVRESKKYPSLLWEITGNGLQKPSYLFGTMHVSDKLAFHLGDSFYHAIKKVDVVALETNPEHWQENYSKSVFFRSPRNLIDDITNINSRNEDLLRINSFAIHEYDEAIKAALAVEPSMINGMLYRSYGSNAADFEEDTFLDMYIFQTGSKLGKVVTGVEDFEESEKLVMEAYLDMMRDRNRKKRSFDLEGIYYNPKKLEDAYRKGDLDVLDSLQELSVFSDAFQEKFMFKRNDIQANSIDSIIRKSSLFVGVGAAHLPGKRGVIEILRQRGYTLRPVRMDERNSEEKDMIDKKRSTLVFNKQVSDDGFFEVNIPGKKFYRFTEWPGLDVIQYADMVNGAYYVVTRIKTNSLTWGHSPAVVAKKIDSLLYENVPGKILKKKAISRNGYTGWDVLSRTRRGDHQRYNIYVTPFEMIVFKMSGVGEYIAGGNEAEQFFGSVKFKEPAENEWVHYNPATAGFAAELPHKPSLLKDENFGANRFEYAAFDPKDGNNYLILKSSVHNYSFVEEDTFELRLLSESYAFSSFIDKELSRKLTKLNGYPALDCKYKHKDGSFSTVKFVIRGPIYYIATVHYKNENENVKRFFKSFAITPFGYPEAKPRVDSNFYFTVQSPVPLQTEEEAEKMNRVMTMLRIQAGAMDEEDSPGRFPQFDTHKSRMIGNDTTGEKILVTYHKSSDYDYIKDTAFLWRATLERAPLRDSSFIVSANKQYVLANGTLCRELQLTDTGSSRLILVKWLYRDGHSFCLKTLTDTSKTRSPFIESFFSSFTPADTLKGQSVFARKNEKLFNDYFSTDSVIAKQARRHIYSTLYDSLDVPLLKNAINRVNWDTRNYMEVKKDFIRELARLKDPSITPFLKELYWKVKDSSEFQNTILAALLIQKTTASFTAFRDLIVQEPPITTDFSSYTMPSASDDVYYSTPVVVSVSGEPITDRRFFGRWRMMYDSLPLTKVIFPGILQLMDIDDYRRDVSTLLTVMVDSGYLKASDYESHFSKLYIDGKLTLKKQFAKEEKDNITRATNKGRADSPLSYLTNTNTDRGNDELIKYAILLMPFYDKNPGIPAFYEQLLKTGDRQLRFETFLLLLRNNKPVNDSFFTVYAKLDEFRSKLYQELTRMKKADKFPAGWKNQAAITRSLFYYAGSTSFTYNKPDSIVYLDKIMVTQKGKKGWVHFYKYRKMKDDTYWQLAAIGMQPEKNTDIDVLDRTFVDKTNYRIDTDKPLNEQLQKMLKEMQYSKRRSASRFYDLRSFSIYKNYMSEAVKGQRYRD